MGAQQGPWYNLPGQGDQPQPQPQPLPWDMPFPMPAPNPFPTGDPHPQGKPRPFQDPRQPSGYPGAGGGEQGTQNSGLPWIDDLGITHRPGTAPIDAGSGLSNPPGDDDWWDDAVSWMSVNWQALVAGGLLAGAPGSDGPGHGGGTEHEPPALPAFPDPFEPGDGGGPDLGDLSGNLGEGGNINNGNNGLGDLGGNLGEGGNINNGNNVGNGRIRIRGLDRPTGGQVGATP